VRRVQRDKAERAEAFMAPEEAVYRTIVPMSVPTGAQIVDRRFTTVSVYSVASSIVTAPELLEKRMGSKPPCASRRHRNASQAVPSPASPACGPAGPDRAVQDRARSFSVSGGTPEQSAVSQY
jgi:hypothetical protein